MNCKIKTRISQIVALSLMIAMVIGFMPQMASPVYAEGDPAMVYETNHVNSSINCAGAPVVWYAGSKWVLIYSTPFGNEYTFEPFEYRDPVTKEMVAVKAMTLLSCSNLVPGGSLFNKSREKGNDYEGSDLKTVVDGLFTSLFSEKEKQAVIERELKVDEYSADKYSNGVSGTETTGYLWPLSTAEAMALDGTMIDEAMQVVDFWWLRSPGGSDDYVAAVVWGPITINNYGVYVDDAVIRGVCPAFNLNRASVLFTSAAEGGKISGNEGVDALYEVGKNEKKEDQHVPEWKLTLKDDGTVIDTKTGLPNTGLSGHKDFKATECTYTDNGVSVEYTGAKTGTNEYISAIITDKSITTKYEHVNITYYGRIKNCVSDDDASGTVEINTAGKLGSADTLYVFNEQCNGDRETDYASTLYEVNPYPPVGRIKAANPLKIKGKTATVKYNKLKKKSQTLTVTKVIKFTKDIKDQKTYKLSSAKKGKKSFSKYFKINKTTGKVTVKKGLKKGTYKVKVKVQAKGNSRYKASKVMPVTFKIKVK